MKRIFIVLSLTSLIFVACHDKKGEQGQSQSALISDKFDKNQFNKLLNTVAEGWNTNNARAAANCFSEDAVYIEPPNQQLYQGRKELFDFFGGEAGRTNPMKMTWHYLIFDEDDQIGTGEYTFEYKGRSTHGIVIVKISEGKIGRWREYQYRSTTEWGKFIGESAF